MSRGQIAAGVLILVALFAGIPAALADTDYGGGTIDGKSWTGYSLVDWGSGGGGMVYWGNGLTSIDDNSDIEQITVDNWGLEYCGPFVFDEGWFDQDTQYDDWFAYASGDGWAQVGECSWWEPQPNVVLAVHSAHNLWEGSDHDRDTTDPFEVTPF